MENFGLLGVVSLGMGQAICMAKITNPAFSQFYQSEGSLSWEELRLQFFGPIQ